MMETINANGTLIHGKWPSIPRRQRCRHHAYEIDALARLVRCQSCGAELDAFKVLNEYATGERTFRDYRRMTRLQSSRLEDLRAEEKRVKARTRNASRKDAGDAVAAERKRLAELARSLRSSIEQSKRKVEWLAKTIDGDQA